jgi:hypothetical protein
MSSRAHLALGCLVVVLGTSLPARAATVFSTDFESGLPSEIVAPGAGIEGGADWAGLGASGNQFSGSFLCPP